VTPSKTYDFPEGELLLIDKPIGWTSFDVVNKIRHMIRYHLGIKKIKVGHAGTLDPLATGLLLVCTGKATKRIPEFTGLDKEYTGTFFLGETTPSFDLETEVDQRYSTAHITENMILETAKGFSGHIQQVPPVYSAIKVDGKRSYRQARMNKEVKLKAREVTIYEFEILQAGIPETDFRVLCSKGTYIRSLANDFGRTLKSGAYLKRLCRTKIGPFSIDQALQIEELEIQLSGQGLKN
jgi:tRNA pseudouridine55 synthase